MVDGVRELWAIMRFDSLLVTLLRDLIGLRFFISLFCFNLLSLRWVLLIIWFWNEWRSTQLIFLIIIRSIFNFFRRSLILIIFHWVVFVLRTPLIHILLFLFDLYLRLLAKLLKYLWNIRVQFRLVQIMVGAHKIWGGGRFSVLGWSASAVALVDHRDVLNAIQICYISKVQGIWVDCWNIRWYVQVLLVPRSLLSHLCRLARNQLELIQGILKVHLHICLLAGRLGCLNSQ